MLYSLGILLILGYISGQLFKKIGLPPLIGMIFTGIIIGENGLNILSQNLLDIAPDLRKLALVIILLRAGLGLRLSQLKAVGRPAILLSFLPAILEIAGICVIAPPLLNITLAEAALLGSVIAAVSPAIIVPRMLNLIASGHGKTHHIPQMIMAAASLDDIFVIVLFTSFSTMVTAGTFSPTTLLQIPISVITGGVLGFIFGILLTKIYKTYVTTPVYQILFILSSSFIFLGIEDALANSTVITMSALFAIIVMSAVIYSKNPENSQPLVNILGGIWQVAEIILFVLVGTSVNMLYVINAGPVIVAVLLFGLVFRVMGVYLSTTKTQLTKKEKLFSAFAYIPKATVQAAIGSIPLSMGLACGETVLTGAVLAIIITAPLGAILIDKTYLHLLEKN